MCVASIIAGAIYCGSVGPPIIEFVPVPVERGAVAGTAAPGTGIRGPVPTPARYREPDWNAPHSFDRQVHILCAMFNNDPVQYPHCARYMK